MSDTICKRLDGSLSIENLLVPRLILVDKIIDIFAQWVYNFVIGAFVVFVLGKGEYIIDVVYECLHGYGMDGGCCIFAEVFLVFLDEEISVVDEVAIELA